ncbi:hypothetical protein AXF42_Ash015184 [Apostasia shenzhenica]|uniref:Surfeit locus protein 2 n=1 Tax=Apostasia shenzhenica TaxID=1088818 RepID=A0A2I0AQR0_9ASPA|nr:hypothetical protein AXF42_Ash015184 [Apostasia shenzhenica]
MEVDNVVPNPKASCTGEDVEKEGAFLLGLPTFLDIGNGRLRCEETGHELPEKERDAYSRGKACRIALIDACLSKKKPPLNTFLPHPLYRSKLVCSLTGDTINKTEEHIWKHINGRRFLKKLEEMEVQKLQLPENVEKDVKKSKKLSKLKATSANTDQKIKASRRREPVLESSDHEEPDFWVPPVGDRWDLDDGKDRWAPCTTSDMDKDADDVSGVINENEMIQSVELAARTKRMAISIGPSSFASRKKKSRKASGE